MESSSKPDRKPEKTQEAGSVLQRRAAWLTTLFLQLSRPSVSPGNCRAESLDPSLPCLTFICASISCGQNLAGPHFEGRMITAIYELHQMTWRVFFSSVALSLSFSSSSSSPFSSLPPFLYTAFNYRITVWLVFSLFSCLVWCSRTHSQPQGMFPFSLSGSFSPRQESCSLKSTKCG